MDILWRPEKGDCPLCGEDDEVVRMYSTGGRCHTMCFACWDANQSGTVLGARDWMEDVDYEFCYSTESPPSTSRTLA